MFARKLISFLFPSEPSHSMLPEVVIWPAASNGRRMVAVCARCRRSLRSGFSAEAVQGPYHHTCEAAEFAISK